MSELDKNYILKLRSEVTILLEAQSLEAVLSFVKRMGPNPEDSFMKKMYKRNIFTNALSWAVPTEECLDAISAFVQSDTIIEVGCGAGFWASLLSLKGVSIIPTDPFLSHGSNGENNFTAVEELSAEQAIEKYQDANVLMILWPSYNDDFAVNALRNFTGNKIVFIGEGQGGCTADDDFYDELSENWEDCNGISLPNWEGIHDYCSFYQRNKSGEEKVD